MPLHQTDFDKDKFGYPAVDDVSPGNPKHVECATILSLIKTSLATPQLMMLLQETPNMWSVQPFCLCWRLVAGGWWLEVGDWSWWQEVGGWPECVSSVCGFIVKGLFFKL